MRAALICLATILSSIPPTAIEMCGCLELRVPNQYKALSGDLVVSLHGLGETDRPARVELLEQDTDAVGDTSPFTVMGSVPVPAAHAALNKTAPLRVTFPCGVVTRGGRYMVRLQRERAANRTDADEQTTDEDMVELEVRWPGARLGLEPPAVATYPEDPVTATVQFEETSCHPAIGSLLPETWLQLIYCGHSVHSCSNSSHRQIVYSEQIRGYPRLRVMELKCHLFGLAGHYSLALQPRIAAKGLPLATSPLHHTLKAEWSEKFVFNVHARSIFPCDTHQGVAVLFQYPNCILASSDRVRVFGRLRADVASLQPPSTLHYVAEQPVSRGQHALRFDCELFAERFVEYCFVYVSKAITGAVSDVRMDCVPTLPVLESESGSWGSLSPWTPCTTSCSGGTRNRYRFCDSPPPRYGAKFCQGNALETEKCGVAVSWDCLFYQDNGGPEVPADRPEVVAEVGPGCRCGCVVHLGTADKTHVVRLSLEQFRLPCTSQWVKIRDGDSLSSNLLAQLAGMPMLPHHVVSSGPCLLLEFFSDSKIAAGEECWGGFLAHAQQLDPNGSAFDDRALSVTSSAIPSPLTRLAVVHIAILVFLSFVFLISACLGAQYIHRYRKYQLAAATEELETITDASSGSRLSLAPLRSRAASTSTVLSEVISLKRFKRSPNHRHTRLNEEMENEDVSLQDSTDSQKEEEKENEEHSRENGGSNVIHLSVSPSSTETEGRPTTLDVTHKKITREQTPRVHRKHRKFKSPVSPVDEGPEEVENERFSSEPTQAPSSCSSVRKFGNGLRPSVSSSVSSSLTTATSSPVSSLRGINPKESKEKRNLARMLAGSEFSLGPDTDLEMDYYDYNVQNASTVPGSYIGMDPAFCVWIPPFAPGQWENSDDEEEDSEEEEEEDVKEENGRELSDSSLPSAEVKEFSSSEKVDKVRKKKRKIRVKTTKFSRDGDDESGSRTPMNERSEDETNSSTKGSKNKLSLSTNSLSASYDNRAVISQKTGTLTYKMVDRIDPDSPVKVHQAYSVREKETKVEKSPSNNSEYFDLLENDGDDDIKFADEDDDEENGLVDDNNVYNKNKIEIVTNSVEERGVRKRTNLK
ncbi:hypothetical protein LSTR_LSTR008207 [Laodelphax striatellus]|uniref:CUB domain-containing protein n=1 Tax=Laodelphax striatellus TaxID=195883 RepID=A0A482WK43_LAOST|nr:hypothetical protein LSTR_LSTR008207 [Laodelphax striatellus]